ncbi:MAG: methionine--tRNA ligase [Candidatus Dojkabacteria bacterium]|nr:methionine--tRNA ligase [Candidatus Dojkabacteria bacterium]
MEKILVAVAWPYVNGDIHPGHMAGYLLPADIFARFNRLLGNYVLMVSGSDCHGTPITLQADKEKVTPIEIVYKYHAKDISLFKKLNLSYDIYTLTVTTNHARIVQNMFLQLLRNGYIYKSTMLQYYSSLDNKFLPDRYVEGKCPFCYAAKQRSDQCEICGHWIPDGQLIEPVSKLSGLPVELKETQHYFFNFAALEKDLYSYVQSKKHVWKDWVYNESIGWLNKGLKSRAITRDIDWGISLPEEDLRDLQNLQSSLNDIMLDNIQHKKIYVWFEAVVGYLSATIEWSQLDNNNMDNNLQKIYRRSQYYKNLYWEDFWFDTSSKHFYFMGQDNLVFHTLMWPAQLIGTKLGYTLPYNVCVNKFLNLEGNKFSKSKGWTVDLSKLVDIYGVDEIRYYIASILPENKESDFRWDSLVEKINNELVGIIGNFIHRSLTLCINTLGRQLIFTPDLLRNDIQNILSSTIKEYTKYIAECKFVDGLKLVLSLAKFGHKYFDESKVWTLKGGQSYSVFANIFQIISILSLLLFPFLPDGASKIREMIGLSKIEEVPGENQLQYIPQLDFRLGDIKLLFKKIQSVQKC